MTDPTQSPNEPASAKRLVRSTLIAAGVAALILVTIVLPAEYGVDPTGAGRLLGLKEMGETKMRLAAEAAADDSAAVATAPPAATSVPAPEAVAATPTQAARTDQVEAVMAPGQAREIKLVMRKDARVTFRWRTNRGVVNYDTHADAPGIRYHGYTKGQGVRADSGTLVAAFDGAHGWFWRNRGTDTVTVTLSTSGDYSDVKRVQ